MEANVNLSLGSSLVASQIAPDLRRFSCDQFGLRSRDVAGVRGHAWRTNERSKARLGLFRVPVILLFELDEVIDVDGFVHPLGLFLLAAVVACRLSCDSCPGPSRSQACHLSAVTQPVKSALESA